MHKIVHIARPLSGVGVYIALLSKHISSSFENIIVCNKNEDCIKIINSENKEIDSHHLDIKRKINPFKDLVILIRLIILLKKIKPDILHCHSAKAGFLGRLAGAFLNIKTFYTPHAYSFLSSNNYFVKNIFKSIEWFFGFLPSYTLACSESEYEIAKIELKINEKKLLLWENSIEDISESTKNKAKGISSDYICSIGRPTYQKNTDLLVNSILELKQKLPNIHLKILGVGYYSTELEKIKQFILNNNLSENITLLPWVDRKQCLSILNDAELFISTSRYEGLPYAVLEALALSKPCILSNIKGHLNLVKNDFNGFLVGNDKELIAEKIQHILTSTDVRLQMSRNSRKIYETSFNIKKNIYKIEEIYLKP